MASAIDATKPIAVNPTTQSVRDNFATARDEISALQSAGYITGNQNITLSGDISGSGTTTIATTLSTVSVAKGGTGATSAPTALSNLGAVAKTGDTMNGALTIQPGSGNAALALRKPASGTAVTIVGATGISARWIFTLGNSIAESGSNAGSDFSLDRYDDSGNWLSSALSFARINGDMQISSGTAIKPGGGPFVAPSDLRLKTSIEPYETGLAEIEQLQPVTYEYNGTAGMPTGERFHGIIADNVTLPEAVGRVWLSNEGEPTEYLTFDSTPLLYALVNSVKQLAAKVEALEAALAAR